MTEKDLKSHLSTSTAVRPHSRRPPEHVVVLPVLELLLPAPLLGLLAAPDCDLRPPRQHHPDEQSAPAKVAVARQCVAISRAGGGKPSMQALPTRRDSIP